MPPKLRHSRGTITRGAAADRSRSRSPPRSIARDTGTVQAHEYWRLSRGKSKLFRKLQPRASDYLVSQILPSHSYGINGALECPADYVMYTTSSGDSNLFLSQIEVCRYDDLGLYANVDFRDNKGMCRRTTRALVVLICEFVNKLRNRNKKGSIPYCTYASDNTFKILQLRGIEHTSRVMTNLWDLPAEKFQKVQYFFWLVAPVAHMTVVVISPINKTIELLDSHWSYADPKKAFEVLREVVRLISFHLGRDFIHRDWKLRMCESANQGLTSYCATYTVTNIALLAFGYGLSDFSRENIPQRIERLCLDMANRGYSDLLNGDVVHDESVYEVNPGWREGQNPSRGWIPLDRDNIVNHLPEEVQARTGTYDDMTEDELVEHLMKSGPTYEGAEHWVNHEDFLCLRDWVELRDFHIKTHKFKAPEVRRGFFGPRYHYKRTVRKKT